MTASVRLVANRAQVLPVNYKWVFVEEADDAGNKSVTIKGIDVAINQVSP